MTKLTPETIAAHYEKRRQTLHAAWKKGASFSELARKYGISKQAARKLVLKAAK